MAGTRRVQRQGRGPIQDFDRGKLEGRLPAVGYVVTVPLGYGLYPGLRECMRAPRLSPKCRYSSVGPHDREHVPDRPDDIGGP